MKFYNLKNEELDVLEVLESVVGTTSGTYHKTKIFNESGKSMYSLEKEDHIFF